MASLVPDAPTWSRRNARGAHLGVAVVDSGNPREPSRVETSPGGTHDRRPRALGPDPWGVLGDGRGDRARARRAGYRICGIHLDFRAGLAHVEEIKAKIAGVGSEALYINMNAADDEKRADALATLRERFDRSRAEGRDPYVRVVMHSLAFGSLVPFLTEDPKAGVDRKKMEMTQDVMANSLVYWVQDLWRGGFLERGSKIFAMTSEGSTRVVPSYGVVSSAKAALESHTRQLAMELARLDTGVTANTIRAGVTLTPGADEDPGEGRDHRGGHAAQPDRPDDDAAGRGERDPRAVGRGHRVHQRRGHRRRRRRVHHGFVSGRVLVVGSVNVDLVVQTERLPLPGETVLGGTFSRFHGGKGGNQAVAAARLGVPVMLVAALGDDAFGAEARAPRSRAQGVGTDVLVTLDHTATGVALILVDAEGGEPDRGGAGRQRRPHRDPRPRGARPPRARTGRRRASSPTRSPPTPPARRCGWAARAVRGRSSTRPRAGGLDRSVLSLADVLTPNRGELAPLVADDARRSGRTTSGAEEPVRAARTLLDTTSEGPGAGQAILVSLGAAGAVLVRRGVRRSTSRRRRSRRSTPPVPATRSTARSPPRWRGGATSSRRRGARSSRRASR